MRSRAVRLTLSAIAVGVLAAAAFFVFNTEQQIEQRRAAALRFEERLRAVERALADIRAAQHAYVAAGQSADAWIPKVASLSSEAGKGVDDLRSAAATADARASLMEASATIVEIGQVDRRVVDYLKTEQDVMAADVVYPKPVRRCRSPPTTWMRRARSNSRAPTSRNGKAGGASCMRWGRRGR